MFEEDLACLLSLYLILIVLLSFHYQIHLKDDILEKIKKETSEASSQSVCYISRRDTIQ